jgi:hypothetical protein
MPRFQDGNDRSYAFVHFPFHIGFPHPHNHPTESFQLSGNCNITLVVATEFGDPEFSIMSLKAFPQSIDSQVFEDASMPIVTVNEDYDFHSGKHNVGLAR